jgi:hypothetical protein
MKRYRTVEEQLAAARSNATMPDILDILAEIPNEAILIAVAENPATSPLTLAGLVPTRLNSQKDRDMAFALAQNSHTPDHALAKLAAQVAQLHASGQDQDIWLMVGVALCCNPNTPFEQVAELLAPNRDTEEFRRIVAQETRRNDVLKLLQNDRSAKVRRQAASTLSL